MSALGIFAINLDRSPERWTRIHEGFSSLDWPLERIPAIDASDIPETLGKRGQSLLLPPDAIGWSMHRHRAFTLAEEACLCSHRKALLRFLDTPFTHALILEDDAVPRPGMSDILRDAEQNLKGRTILKLSGNAQKGTRLAIETRRTGSFLLVRSLRPTSNAGAYVVTREAAAAILDTLGRLLIPIDDFLSSPSLHGCDLLHVSPWPVVCAGFPSTMREVKSKRPVPQHRRESATSRALTQVRRGVLRMRVWTAAIGGPSGLLRLRQIPWM